MLDKILLGIISIIFIYTIYGMSYGMHKYSEYIWCLDYGVISNIKTQYMQNECYKQNEDKTWIVLKK